MTRRLPKWLFLSVPVLFALGCLCFALAGRWDGVGIFLCVGALYSVLMWNVYQRQRQ